MEATARPVGIVGAVGTLTAADIVACGEVGRAVARGCIRDAYGLFLARFGAGFESAEVALRAFAYAFEGR